MTKPDSTNDAATEDTSQEPQEGAVEETEEQAETQTEETPEESVEDAEGPEVVEDESGTDEDELPEWVKKELKKARSQAASYRTKFGEASTKLAEAVSPEDFKKVQDDLAEANLLLETERIASKYELPDELRAVLKGDTVEQITESAELLAKFVGGNVDTDNLSGGLDPTSNGSTKESPRDLARKHRRNR